MVRWAFWGFVVGLIVLATLLPSWRPDDRLPFGLVVLGVPTLIGIGFGWLRRRP